MICSLFFTEGMFANLLNSSTLVTWCLGNKVNPDEELSLDDYVKIFIHQISKLLQLLQSVVHFTVAQTLTVFRDFFGREDVIKWSLN